MSQTQLATRIDTRVKKAVESACLHKGVKMGRFIEDALLDKLEELDDVEDLKSLRHESARPFSEVLKELKAHGKL